MNHLPALSRFLRFVNERESLRIRKASGHPGPWTDDPILAKYRFCNVRRRDDRVSQWLLNNWYPKMSGPDIWLAAAVARLINWPPTLDAFLEAGVTVDDAGRFDVTGFKHVVSLLREDKAKIYTGAYMVYPGSGAGGTFTPNKEDFLADILLKGLIDNQDKVRAAIATNSIEATVGALSSSYGTQTFMAGQIAADLTYLPGHLDRATDLYSFAPRGPGSQRGLNRFYGNKLSYMWKQDEFNAALRYAGDEVVDQLGIVGLTLHDLQNCFCEWDKHERVRLGEGKPRSNYQPETAY